MLLEFVAATHSKSKIIILLIILNLVQHLSHFLALLGLQIYLNGKMCAEICSSIFIHVVLFKSLLNTVTAVVTINVSTAAADRHSPCH